MQFQEKMMHLKEMSGRTQKAYKSNIQSTGIIMNVWNMNILIPLHKNMSLDLEFPWTTWRNGEPNFTFSSSSSCSFPLNIFLNTLPSTFLNVPVLKVIKILFDCSALVLS